MMIVLKNEVENNRLPMHTKYFIQNKIASSIVQKLSKKQRVLKWFLDLIDLEQHTARDKQAMLALEILSASHVFDYIVLRLTLAWSVVKTLLQPCQH